MTARERREINTSSLANIVTDCALFEAEKRIKELEDETLNLKKIISDHNQSCVSMCGDKSHCGFIGYARDCGNCYKDFMIDLPTTKQGE